MAVTRKVRHMNEDGTIVEADIGVLAENVKEDTQRRFVSDKDKEKWNGHVAADGGDISETNITLEEQAADTKYPAMPTDAKKSKTTGGIFKRWLESLKTDKVDVSGGDISNTKIASVTASDASYPVPAAGDTGKVFMGKVAKFFGDIRNATTGACFIGQIVNNCVSTDTNKPLSAAQGKYLMDLYNGLNTNSQNALSLAQEVHHQMKNISDLPEDSNLDDVVQPGWYNVYTTIDGLKYRWLINVETVSIGDIYWRRQTAYYYMGGAYNTPPRQRSIYYVTSGVWGYTPWFRLSE